MELEGTKALVCGATQGIGRACAKSLAEKGAELVLFARNEETLRKVAAELPSPTGQRHSWIAADFNNIGSVASAVGNFIARSGPVQILINNSGGPPGGPVLTARPEEFIAAFTQHLVCSHVVTQAVVPGMKASQRGRIINILSTSVRTPLRGLGVSNTIRAAMANWARTLAWELGPSGITVNNVLPGPTDTARLRALIAAKAKREGLPEDELGRQMKAGGPMGRFARPEEIASAVAFLASPAASYVSGVDLLVDGGRLATIPI